MGHEVADRLLPIALHLWTAHARLGPEDQGKHDDIYEKRCGMAGAPKGAGRHGGPSDAELETGAVGYL